MAEPAISEKKDVAASEPETLTSSPIIEKVEETKDQTEPS